MAFRVALRLPRFSCPVECLSPNIIFQNSDVRVRGWWFETSIKIWSDAEIVSTTGRYHAMFTLRVSVLTGRVDGREQRYILITRRYLMTTWTVWFPSVWIWRERIVLEDFVSRFACGVRVRKITKLQLGETTKIDGRKWELPGGIVSNVSFKLQSFLPSYPAFSCLGSSSGSMLLICKDSFAFPCQF